MESMEAMGMKGSFLWSVFSFCLRIMQNVFFPFVSLRDRRSEEETCVDGSGNVW